MTTESDLAPVLITGASGFVGRSLSRRLARDRIGVRALVRDPRTPVLYGDAVTGDLADPESLRGICDGVQTVFHLAGYAHANDADTDHAGEVHERITVNGTAALIAEAARAGVRRLVFASSVKAMGEGGPTLLDESSPVKPAGAYGRAKRSAEAAVLAAGREHGMHTCVLRFPLMYGPEQRGNLARMVDGVARGRFPPIPDTANRRSMLHVEDAVAALLLAARDEAAQGEIYIVTDGRAYTTRAIVNDIHRAFGRTAPRWSIPHWMLSTLAGAGSAIAAVTGVSMPLTLPKLDKLLGSAWYSSEKIKRELGFSPQYDFTAALPDIVALYRERAQRE